MRIKLSGGFGVIQFIVVTKWQVVSLPQVVSVLQVMKKCEKKQPNRHNV